MNPLSCSKLVLATAWYRSRSAKFPSSTYIQWMKNFLPGVRRFYLVVFTDKTSFPDVQQAYPGIAEDPRIRVVLMEREQWAGYEFRDAWIDNHRRNVYLNQAIDWEVNMMWSEKIMFVKRVVDNLDRYFPQLAVAEHAALAVVDMVGWCDIGYFRDAGEQDMVRQWPEPSALQVLSRKKIHYGMILDTKNKKEHQDRVRVLMQIVADRDEHTGLPKVPIPPTQNCFAGGFFLCHPTLIDGWNETYTDTLRTYFRHRMLVKDDQIILTHCILSQTHRFQIHRLEDAMGEPAAEHRSPRDPWFLFRYVLLRPFPQITVLMPLYNGIEFLAESVASVVKQTYPRWNIVIGVNGYDEPRGAVWQEADALVRNHPEWASFAERGQIQVWDVRFPAGVAKGKGAALNVMVQRIMQDCQRDSSAVSSSSALPKPDFWAILDVDDVWYPDKLRQQICTVPEFHRYDVIGTQCEYFCHDDHQHHPSLHGLRPAIPLGKCIHTRHDFLVQGNPMINSSVLIRCSSGNPGGVYWDDRFRGLEDYDLWIRMWRQGKQFYNVPVVLVKHRIHDQSAFNAHGQNAKQLADFLSWQRSREENIELGFLSRVRESRTGDESKTGKGNAKSSSRTIFEPHTDDTKKTHDGSDGGNEKAKATAAAGR